MKQNTIKIKMILLIFITLIPLSALRVIEIRQDFRTSIEAELNSSEEFAEAISSSFTSFIERSWATQYAIGEAIVRNPDWNSEDMKKYFASIALDDKVYGKYSWTDSKGVVIASSDEIVINKDMSSVDFVKEVIRGQDKVLGNIKPSVVDSSLIIPIARGVRVNGELKGIIVSIINVKDIRSIFPAKRLGNGSTFGLIDRNANLVYRNGNDNIPFEKRKIRQDSPARRALKGEVVKTYGRNSGFDGTKRIGIDYPIGDLGWSCFVTTDSGHVLGGKKKEIAKNIILFIIIYLVSFSIAIIFASRIIKPINRLKAVAKEVMEGNLWVKTNISPKGDLGDVGQAFDNMTEGLRDRVKEIEEYNNLKAQFLSTMSHELKTPLNIILGCIQLLETFEVNTNEELHKKYNKYIKMQKQNSFRLLRLINNIVDINKLEENNLVINPSNNDIVKVVEDITLSVVEYTRLKNINVIFDTEVEEKIIAFDIDMMERIILNLLSNAIKFTEGGGTIEVNIYDGEDSVAISIKDNGIGIPKDKLQMIFDRFTQVDNSLRRRSEGSGIGLSLVKSLVELHGGSVSVESRIGCGSEFIVKLPVRLTDNESHVHIKENLSSVEKVNVEFSDIYI
ncbi:signal transduction histidine kinase [Clostridium punense]|uniref:histidine kinase n=1 Tax=Clostridium punense TaxID=1054297 RepID=A0ABS4K3S9_9CLOT|nr:MULTISPECIES: sensor histidine kinase [Clostridium]EQB90232.1 hypothetical protein M918_01155 [Clostridium sp. BL8]MBP2022449.1 signal transduction histidine kinase [Clostridium punense]